MRVLDRSWRRHGNRLADRLYLLQRNYVVYHSLYDRFDKQSCAVEQVRSSMGEHVNLLC